MHVVEKPREVTALEMSGYLMPCCRSLFFLNIEERKCIKKFSKIHSTGSRTRNVSIRIVYCGVLSQKSIPLVNKSAKHQHVNPAIHYPMEPCPGARQLGGSECLLVRATFRHNHNSGYPWNSVLVIIFHLHPVDCI
jgi:hypothetical protein